jgi:ubiquinone/menaquinone biosynthesis C-methylase UbiE
MLRKFIASQFKKPSVLFGSFASNIMMKNNQKNYDKLTKDLDIHTHEKLLEIGYGPGLGIEMVAKACSTCTVHGIDFSKLMYKQASKHNKSFIDSGIVQLQFGDFLKTPVISNNYDKIFCLNVIYFWNELKSPFEKVFSLLKEGGAFHIYMANRDALVKMKTPDSVFNKYSVEQVTEALKFIGFKDVEHYSEKGIYIKARK